jgi:hypothetical protein
VSEHSERRNIAAVPLDWHAAGVLPGAGAHHGDGEVAGMLGCSVAGGARGVADNGLAGYDPVIAPGHPDLIAAAIVFARGGAGDAEALLLWARYAYRAAQDLYGPVSLLALRAAWIYQRVLTRQGLMSAAVGICQQRLAGYRQRGDASPALAARISLINALHADGQCDLARCDIVALRRQWLHQPGDTGFTQQIVLTHVVIAAGCGHTHRAEQILHRNTTVLAGLGPEGRGLAAVWLATAEKFHPRVCQREPAPLPVRDVDDRSTSWLAALIGDPDASRTDGGRP